MGKKTRRASIDEYDKKREQSLCDTEAKSLNRNASETAERNASDPAHVYCVLPAVVSLCVDFDNTDELVNVVVYILSLTES